MHRTLLEKNRLSIFFLSVTVFLLAIVYGGFVWVGDVTDFGGDSSGYLLAARYYSPYHAVLPAILEYKSQIIYPPLFPWMLALVNGGHNLLMAHLLIAVFTLAGVITLFIWVRKEHLPLSVSFSVVLVYAAMPATYIQMLNIWTEFPYIFFSIAAILAVSDAETSSSHKIWLFAAVLVACATLLRVAALPLLVAFGMLLLFRRPKNYVWIGLFASLPFLLWLIYSDHTETGASGYLGHWKEKYALDPLGTFIHQLKTESLALLSAWKYAWLGEAPPNTLVSVTYGFGIISLAGWLCRLKSLKFDAIYVAIYLCMLLAWPHPEEALRYSFVLYPVLVANGFLLLAKILPQQIGFLSNVKVMDGVAMLLLLTMLPTLLMNVRYFMAVVPAELSEAKHIPGWYGNNRTQALQTVQFHARLLGHLKEIKRFVPENECIFAIKPTVITLYSDRSSYVPPKIFETNEEFGEKIKKCRFAYVLPFASPSYAVPLYPLDRLGESAKILSIQYLYEEGGQIVGALIEIPPQESTRRVF